MSPDHGGNDDPRITSVRETSEGVVPQLPKLLAQTRRHFDVRADPAALRRKHENTDLGSGN